MALPLLLGLGLLAGNELFRQQRAKTKDEEMASAYRGLLGAPGSESMGPPTEGGQMGYQGGSGLLADPSNILNQMKFAAGVAGLPGQQAAGMQMLNAAFGRQQQQQAQDQGAAQWQQNFGRLQAGDAAQASQFERTFAAGRDDKATQAQQWAEQFAQQQAQQAQQARQWGADYGLRREGLNLQRAGMEQRAAGEGGPAMPKLPAGYGYRPDGVAQPMPGTPDYAKGVSGFEALTAADERIGTMLDMIEGKETTLRSGKRVRMGGVGSEAWGENSARYSTLRGQVISDVAKLRDMGVLQAGEMERIEEALPDPSSWGSYLKSNKTTGRGYQELRDQFRRKRSEHLTANPWLAPPMPEGFRVKGP